jgi:hypothetical protein
MTLISTVKHAHRWHKEAIMASSKPIGGYIYGLALVVLASLLATTGSSAAEAPTGKTITKLFLTSGQVDLTKEVVRLPLHRGGDNDGIQTRRVSSRKPLED